LNRFIFFLSKFKEKKNVKFEDKNNKQNNKIVKKSIKNGKLNIGELSKKLMNKLDKEKKGYVKTNDLIEEMVNRNEELIEDEFFDFFKKINEILQSKSEDIIIKLRIFKCFN
jgi:ribosome recycling factor